jgi:hypothetical protein
MLSDAKEIAISQKKNKNISGILRLLNRGDESLLYKHFMKEVFNQKKWDELSEADV